MGMIRWHTCSCLIFSVILHSLCCHTLSANPMTVLNAHIAAENVQNLEPIFEKNAL